MREKEKERGRDTEREREREREREGRGVIEGSWVQIPLRPTFRSYFKETVSGGYHIY